MANQAGTDMSVLRAPVLRKIDRVQLNVGNLDDAITYYERLGLELIWQQSTRAGLRLPDSDAQLVLQTDTERHQLFFRVGDVVSAAAAFATAGGKLVDAFESETGACAVVEDPWQNRLVLSDMQRSPARRPT